MFVKYLHENDLIERGFTPGNKTDLHPESFSKIQFNDDSGIATLMHVWLESNIYHYTISTERESIVTRGEFTKKEQLDNILKQYFTDDYVSYLERRNNKTYSSMEKVMLRKNMKKLSMQVWDVASSVRKDATTDDLRDCASG